MKIGGVPRFKLRRPIIIGGGQKEIIAPQSISNAYLHYNNSSRVELDKNNSINICSFPLKSSVKLYYVEIDVYSNVGGRLQIKVYRNGISVKEKIIPFSSNNGLKVASTGFFVQHEDNDNKDDDIVIELRADNPSFINPQSCNIVVFP